MPVNTLLILAACLLEAIALIPLILNRPDSGAPGGWLEIHTLAAAMIATGIWRWLTPAQRRPAAGAWLLLFMTVLFLPGLGMTGLLLCVLAAYWLPSVPPAHRFATVSAPVYRPVHLPEEPALPIGRVREQLLNGQSSTELRMKVLLAIQHMPTRHTAAVLREALADPADDLRLLAYGMIESKERQLMLRIQNALQLRETCQGQAERHAIARELTELYWEMVYQNLVQGDMRRFALDQVALYAREALAIDAGDAGIFLIYGRMHLLNGHYPEAETALAAAIQHGCLPVRVSPYIAELAFLRRDFDTVRNLMQHHLPEGRLPKLRQAATYWGKHEYQE